MHSALHHRSKGFWPEAQAEGTITLDYDARHRRRAKLATDQGEAILLDLPHAVAMANGDGLRLGDGRWIMVQAAPEHLIEVRHDDPHQLARLAWHLGNRHLPAEIRPGAIRIRPDHVIEEMLARFGAQLTKLQAAFQPEGGAYAGHDRADHSHERDHGHPHHHEHGGS